MTNIVIATSNKGKVDEIRDILSDFSFNVIPVSDIGPMPDVVEDGKTFLENALKKAKIVSETYNVIALADDSGLEVDALNGAPGVYSARYAGEQATDSENNKKLLTALKDIPNKDRTARFRCCVVVYKPDGHYVWAEGICEGIIAREPRGDKGFGYDPIFYLPSLKKTMAELNPKEKNRLSHRFKALLSLKEKLFDFI